MRTEREIGRVIVALASKDPSVREVSQAVSDSGGALFVVGGAIRDVAMGKDPKDLDLMVMGIPESQLHQLLDSLPGELSLKGASFKVFRYAYDRSRAPVEISMPRRETSTGPGHRDFDVQSDHTVTLEEDLLRRDFTVNAMAVRLPSGNLYDLTGGLADVRAGRLVVITEKSLMNDPLRIMRGLVAVSRHGLVPTGRTKRWMVEAAPSLLQLPTERLRDELDKLFEGSRPVTAIQTAREVGALHYVLPEVDECVGFDQNNPHHELELGHHLLWTMDRIRKVTQDKDLVLAALLHDIGKRWDPENERYMRALGNRGALVAQLYPRTAFWTDPETGRFHYYEKKRADGTSVGHDHADVGAEMTRELMTALKYTTARVNRVTGIVRHHMYAGFDTPRGARRFLARVGDLHDDLFALRWADQGGKDTAAHNESEPEWDVNVNRELVQRVLLAEEAFDRSKLAVSGADVMELGVPQGPQVGEILKELTDLVIEDPSLNERARLRAVACRILTLDKMMEMKTDADA